MEIKHIVISGVVSVFVLISTVVGLSVLSSTTAAAADLNRNCSGFDCVTKPENTKIISDSTGNTNTVQSFSRTLTNTLLYLIGAISVIVIVYGGIMYTISGGDSAAVTKAKNTILYAAIGLVVSLLAFAVVNFVITAF